jgi:hypothetical protein
VKHYGNLAGGQVLPTVDSKTAVPKPQYGAPQPGYVIMECGGCGHTGQASRRQLELLDKAGAIGPFCAKCHALQGIDVLMTPVQEAAK